MRLKDLALEQIVLALRTERLRLAAVARRLDAWALGDVLEYIDPELAADRVAALAGGEGSTLNLLPFQEGAALHGFALALRRFQLGLVCALWPQASQMHPPGSVLCYAAARGEWAFCRAARRALFGGKGWPQLERLAFLAGAGGHLPFLAALFAEVDPRALPAARSSALEGAGGARRAELCRWLGGPRTGALRREAPAAPPDARECRRLFLRAAAELDAEATDLYARLAGEADWHTALILAAENPAFGEAAAGYWRARLGGAAGVPWEAAYARAAAAANGAQLAFFAAHAPFSPAAALRCLSSTVYSSAAGETCAVLACEALLLGGAVPAGAVEECFVLACAAGTLALCRLLRAHGASQLLAGRSVATDARLRREVGRWLLDAPASPPAHPLCVDVAAVHRSKQLAWCRGALFA